MSTHAVLFNSLKPNPNLPQIYDVSPDEVRQKIGKIKIIDVRRPDEWTGELGHIAEAELITLDTLPNRIHEIPQDQTVVFVCRSGGRSAQATAFALENGYTTVFNMHGGMLEWNAKKFETDDSPGPS